MSSRPLKPNRSKLAVRLGAALVTSLVVQRGRMRALLKEAQHRGSTYFSVPVEDSADDENQS